MKLDKIQELENEINKTSFEKSNKSKYFNWLYTSYIFQFLNIIITFFGLYLFLSKVISDFPFKEYIIGGISLVMLIFWERLKREQIRTTSINYMVDKFRIKSNNLINLFLTLFLVVCSSLIAIRGGVELSDKQSHIEVKTDNTLQIKVDSINNIYNNEISKIETRQQFIYTNAKNRKGETRALNTIELDEVNKLDEKINTLKNEKESKIKSSEDKINSKKDKQNFENKNIVTIFVISSLIFELFIIFGVIYTSYYDFNSFNEITQSDGFKKQKTYLDYLNIFYENGTAKKDDKCISETRLTDIIKMKFKSNQSIKEFLTLLYYLKIIETKMDKRRYFCVNYEDAIEKLKNYFN